MWFDDTRESSALSRRSVVKRLGAGTAVVWSAPVVLTIDRAFATGSAPPCTDPPNCVITCEGLRKIRQGTNDFLDELLLQHPEKAAQIEFVRAQANAIFDAALEALDCCPVTP